MQAEIKLLEVFSIQAVGYLWEKFSPPVTGRGGDGSEVLVAAGSGCTREGFGTKFRHGKVGRGLPQDLEFLMCVLSWRGGVRSEAQLTSANRSKWSPC